MEPTEEKAQAQASKRRSKRQHNQIPGLGYALLMTYLFNSAARSAYAAITA